MITKEEFIRHCDSVIPQEEKDLYKKKTKNMWIAIAIDIVATVLLTYLLKSLWEYFIYVLPIVGLIVLIIIIATMKYKWKDFKKKYSKQVFDCLLKGYKYEYDMNRCISSHIFNASGFGGDFDSYSGEDLLSVDIPNDDGTPSGIKFNVCDLHVTKQETRTVTVKNEDGSTSTRTEEYTVTVYSGVFGYVYFPFKFKCNLSLNISFRGEKRIKLEDIKFNKKFKTYTNNQLEALIILTPAFMQKLLKFAHDFKVKLSLRDSGTLYLGINKNLFKLKTFNQKPCGKVFERFYDDVENLLVFIDEIKNNNKIFKM